MGDRRRRRADRARGRSPDVTRPFLFLGIRAQDAAADDEYAAVLRCAGLDERDVRRVRIEQEVLEPLDLDDWSGIVVGGGPWNVSDPEDEKEPDQVRGEARLRELALQVVAADFPFLGACYGIGTLGTLAGGVVDRTYSEPIGPDGDHAVRGGPAGPAARWAVRPVHRAARPQGGGVPAARRRRAARVVGDLPGPGVPDRRATSTPPSSTPSSTSPGSSRASRPTGTTATSSRTRPTRSSTAPARRTSPSRRGSSKRFVELFAVTEPGAPGYRVVMGIDDKAENTGSRHQGPRQGGGRRRHRRRRPEARGPGRPGRGVGQEGRREGQGRRRGRQGRVQEVVARHPATMRGRAGRSATLVGAARSVLPRASPRHSSAAGPPQIHILW